jgi:hypothetical protein
MARTYVIESTMRGTPRGGDWNGPWALHTTLPVTNLRDARQEFRKFIRMWEMPVRKHFRLARYWGERVTLLSA